MPMLGLRRLCAVVIQGRHKEIVVREALDGMDDI